MLRAIWQTADPINPAPFALGASSSPIRILETHRLPADRDGNARALVVITENKAVLPLILHHVGTQWRIDLLDSERMTSGGSDGLSGGLKF